jgi:hypothetical protein
VKPYLRYCQPSATKDLKSSSPFTVPNNIRAEAGTLVFKGPEGFRVEATEGEAVFTILRTFGNEGSEVLRPLKDQG